MNFKRFFQPSKPHDDSAALISSLRDSLAAADCDSATRLQELELLNAELVLAVHEIKTLSNEIVGKLQGQVDLLANELAAVEKTSYDAIFILDYRGDIVSANQVVEKVFGYTSKEIHKKNISRLIPYLIKSSNREVRLFAKIIEKISTVLSTRLEADVLEDEDEYYNTISSVNRLEGIRKDKSKVLIDVAINVISANVSSPKEINYVCIVRDVTELATIRTDLDTAISFQKSLIESVPAAVFWKDKKFRIVGCNAATERLYGISRDKIIGKTVADVFDPFVRGLSLTQIAQIKSYVARDVEVANHLAEEAMAGKRIRRHFYKSRVFNVLEDGIKDVIIYRNVLYNSNNVFEGLIYYVIDVTDMSHDSSWFNLTDLTIEATSK